MIKSTFCNLPEEKKQRVQNAIIKEFACIENDKVSINRIIKDANISRGSFYQYFDDKLDLVEVIIRYFINVSAEDVRRAITVSDGDIFYTYEVIFDVWASFAEDNEKKRVLTTLISSARATNNLVADYMVKRFKGLDERLLIDARFSTKGYSLSQDEDMRYLQQILISVLKDELVKYYLYDSELSAVKARYLRKLYIIKQGVLS